jgi:hypothetical protein
MIRACLHAGTVLPFNEAQVVALHGIRPAPVGGLTILSQQMSPILGRVPRQAHEHVIRGRKHRPHLGAFDVQGDKVVLFVVGQLLPPNTHLRVREHVVGQVPGVAAVIERVALFLGEPAPLLNHVEVIGSGL